jgi:spermidine synthase
MKDSTKRLGDAAGRRHYIGIFLLALATLLLELSLTRVLSVANWYHFGFLVISTALLGFGASGTVLTLWTGLRERVPLDRALAALCVAFGVTTILSFWLMQRIPFDPFKLLVDRRQLVFIPLYYVVLAAPFFCAGLAIALLFTRCPAQVNRLYAADLLGAGLGCAAIAAVMPAFGGSGSVAVGAMLGLLAAVAFGFSQARRLAACAAVLAVLTLALALVADRALPIAVTREKQGHPLLPIGEKPIYTAWNTFSRVDVYNLPAMPSAGRPDPGYSIMLDQGAAGTAMADLSGGVRNYLAHAADYRPPGLTYIGNPHPKVLVIGSGSGREVLEALYFGASSVTAVEINPIINDIVTRRMRQQWGGLFEQPEVQLVTEDGRSFVRRSKEKYDAIVSIQTMSPIAMTSGALTIAETYILTLEAFGDYLDHLTPDGVLLMTRPAQQLPKLFATARELFETRGLGSPADHLLAFDAPLMPYGARQFHAGFLMKKSPFTADELRTLKERLKVGQPDPWTHRTTKIYYSPGDVGTVETDEISSLLSRLLTAVDLHSVYAANAIDLAPATDNRPFFNQTVRWSALRPYNVRSIIEQGRGGVDIQPVAQVTLVVLFVQAVAVAAFLILLPLARLPRQGLRPPHAGSFLIYFAGLGFGFIMIEIVFLQWFSLFLGEPVYTYAVVLASLLIFTGVGSFLTARFPRDPRRMLLVSMLVLLAVLAAMTFATPRIFSATLGLPFPWRVTIALAVIAPLGILLGMPFPTGLRIVAEEAPTLVPWAWGVNGFSTVIGSVGAIVLGMAFGFLVVLAVAGACYLASVAAMFTPRAGMLLRRGVDRRAGGAGEDKRSPSFRGDEAAACLS